jgi:hypothetical protein
MPPARRPTAHRGRLAAALAGLLALALSLVTASCGRYQGRSGVGPAPPAILTGPPSCARDPSCKGPVSDHGQVVPNPAVEPVYWGPGTRADHLLVRATLRAMATTGWWGLLRQYGVGPLRAERARSVGFRPPITIFGELPAPPVPSPRRGTILLVLLGPSASQGMSQRSYCGWHGRLPVTGTVVAYTVMGGGHGSCPYPSQAIAHELAEAATDPSPGLGWRSPAGWEVADLCARSPATTFWLLGTRVSLPALWDQAADSCAQPQPVARSSAKATGATTQATNSRARSVPRP